MSTMSKRILKTVSEIIDALGGPTVVAGRFNIGQSAVSNWNMRGEIPTGWHLRIYLSIRQMGMDVDPEVFGLDTLEGLGARQQEARRKRSAQRPAA
jgi:hypothetical protein